MDAKKWYLSKTFWANAIYVVGDIYLRFTGHQIPAGVDVYILGGINFILRFVTKKPVVW